jgi:hypothetical protein
VFQNPDYHAMALFSNIRLACKKLSRDKHSSYLPPTSVTTKKGFKLLTQGHGGDGVRADRLRAGDDVVKLLFSFCSDSREK